MNKLLLVILSLSVLACQSKYENVKIVSSPNKSIYLSGESLGVAESLGNPSSIDCFDSLLFLKEGADDYKMTVCDPTNKKVINKLIPKGRGPGEQVGTFFFTYSPNTRKIYSFDITLRRMLELKMDSIAVSDYKPTRAFNWPQLNVLQGAMLNDSTFVVSGNTDDFRVAMFTLGGSVNKFGCSPDPKHKMNAILNEAYMGKMKASPCGEKFVLACRYADQLEIFNLRDTQQVLVKGPELFEPSYSIKKLGSYQVLGHNKDELYGYTNVYAGDKYIYALYAGRVKEKGGMYCNTIRVFTWDGEYVQDYILDHSVSCFTLDEGRGILYGIVSQPGAEIYKFKIPEA